MKKYIDFNTEKGMNAANDFEKDFFKLMINSVYRSLVYLFWICSKIYNIAPCLKVARITDRSYATLLLTSSSF